MNERVSSLAARIAELEKEFEAEFKSELEEKRRRFRYSFEKGRIAFDAEICALHVKVRKSWIKFLWDAPRGSLLAAPVIYSLLIPVALLDAWLWLYQGICFPIYGIEKADRSLFVHLDRGHLKYLNWIESFNCNYCGYANGVIAYAREVSSRTEQYFCPIKHARRQEGAHARYQNFLDFGDAAAYREEWRKLREELRPGK